MRYREYFVRPSVSTKLLINATTRSTMFTSIGVRVNNANIVEDPTGSTMFIFGVVPKTMHRRIKYITKFQDLVKMLTNDLELRSGAPTKSYLSYVEIHLPAHGDTWRVKKISVSRDQFTIDNRIIQGNA